MDTKEVRIDTRGHELHGTLFMPKELGQVSVAGVLLAHGYQSNRAGYREYAEAVTSQTQTACLTVDLAGHGDSAGNAANLSPWDHSRDLQAAYDHLTFQKQVDSRRIGVVGASYSGYLASILSGKRPVNRLLLRAPAIYPDEFIFTPRESFDQEALEDYRLNITPESRNYALDAVSELPEGHVTTVDSEKDESIPAPVIIAYLAASRGIYKMIQGATHVLDNETRPVFKDMVVEWAKEL